MIILTGDEQKKLDITLDEKQKSIDIEKHLKKAKEYFDAQINTLEMFKIFRTLGNSKYRNAESQFYLAKCFSSGIEINDVKLKINFNLAFKYYFYAMKNGLDKKLIPQLLKELENIGNDTYLPEYIRAFSYNILGEVYLWGYSVENDLYKAKNFLEICASLNGGEMGKWRIGYIYEEVAKIKKANDDMKSYYEFEKKAFDCYSMIINDKKLKKNKELMGYAHSSLGEIYYYGKLNNVPNYKQAFEHYKKAVKFENLYGCNSLANCYSEAYDKCGIKQDLQKAFKLYTKGIEFYKKQLENKYQFTHIRGNFLFMRNKIASCYYKGEGVATDKKNAELIWKTIALPQKGDGYHRGMFNYALCLLNKKNIEKDKYNLAFELIEKCYAKKPLDEYKYLIGIFLLQGGVTKTNLTVDECFNVAQLNDNNYEIDYNAGILNFKNGNYRKALNFWEKVLSSNNINIKVKAYNNIASLVFDEKYGLLDKNKAFDYWVKSSELNKSIENENALYNASHILYLGRGMVQSNREVSIQIMKYLSTNGSYNNISKYRSFYFSMRQNVNAIKAWNIIPCFDLNYTFDVLKIK